MNINIVDTAELKTNKEAKQQNINTLYNSMISITQEIRGTVERMTLWGCGLILALDGWLATSDKNISSIAKIILSFGVLLFGTITIFIVQSLKTRYQSNAQVIRKLNELQLAHTTGEYFQDEALFPDSWKLFGTKDWKEPIFTISYVSLPGITIFGIIVIWVL